MRLALGGLALVGQLISTIGSYLESEYELRSALRIESLVDIACTEKENLTRLAIEQQEQAIEQIAKLIEQQIADTSRRQASLSRAFDDINARLQTARSEHELKACLKAQRLLTGIMNNGITSLQNLMAVEFKKISSQSTKLLEE